MTVLTPVRKPERVHEICQVDIARLKAIVEKTSDSVWQRENAQKENQFACFHHTDHIVFRFIEGLRDHRVSYSRQIWSAWQGLIQPMMDDIASHYGFQDTQYPKVMLARLKAGFQIDPHVDGAGSNLYTHKIHVPLQTNPAAEFYVNGETFHMKEGFAYEVNNIDRHGASNLGQEDRIHLIFEIFDGAAQA